MYVCYMIPLLVLATYYPNNYNNYPPIPKDKNFPTSRPLTLIFVSANPMYQRKEFIPNANARQKTWKIHLFLS